MPTLDNSVLLPCNSECFFQHEGFCAIDELEIPDEELEVDETIECNIT